MIQLISCFTYLLSHSDVFLCEFYACFLKVMCLRVLMYVFICVFTCVFILCRCSSSLGTTNDTRDSLIPRVGENAPNRSTCLSKLKQFIAFWLCYSVSVLIGCNLGVIWAFKQGWSNDNVFLPYQERLVVIRRHASIQYTLQLRAILRTCQVSIRTHPLGCGFSSGAICHI